jgi:hypothetical protein
VVNSASVINITQYNSYNSPNIICKPINSQGVTDITTQTNELRKQCLAKYQQKSNLSKGMFFLGIAALTSIFALSILIGVCTGGLGFIAIGMVGCGILLATHLTRVKQFYNNPYGKIAKLLEGNELTNFAKKNNIPLTIDTVIKNYKFFNWQRKINVKIEKLQQKKLMREIEEYKQSLKRKELLTFSIA